MKRDIARVATLMLALLVVLTMSVAPAVARPDARTISTVTDIPEPPESGDDKDVLTSDGDGDDLVGGNLGVPDITSPDGATSAGRSKGLFNRFVEFLSKLGVSLQWKH